MSTTNKFEFQPLPYSYDALEPLLISKQWKFIMANTIRLIMTNS